MERAWATGEWWDGGQSNAFDDERHRKWWARYLRMAASPAMAQNVIRMNMRLDIRDVLPKIDVPTLILHRTGDSWIDVGHARYLARAHPERDLRRAARIGAPAVARRRRRDRGRDRGLPDRPKSRPRRRTNIGVDALSRREREVALLASRGETAQEIADQLFMSKRTVESHLVSIYAKLGVSAKTELIRRAAEFGIS